MKKLVLFSMAALIAVLFVLGCKLEETPDENRYFQEVVELNGLDAIPLSGVERQDGKIHVLIYDNGYFSAILDENLKVDSLTSLSFNTDFVLEDVTSTSNGGFVMCGSTNSSPKKGRVVTISPNMTVLSDLFFTFSPESYLEFEGVTEKSNVTYLIGKLYYFDALPNFFMVPSVVIVDNLTGEKIDSFYIEQEFVADKIAKLPNDFYAINGKDGANSALLWRNQSAYSEKVIDPIGKGFNLIASIGDFIIRSGSKDNTTQSGQNIDIIIKSDKSGNVVGEINVDTTQSTNIVGLLASDSDNIIILKSSPDSLILAEYNSVQMGNDPIWGKSYFKSGGKVDYLNYTYVGSMFVKPSVSKTKNGYLITAGYVTETGQQRVFLIKTDSKGNTQ